MARKYKPEEIICKLRGAEIVLAQGGKMADACRRIGVTEQSYYRWSKKYGVLKMDQARRMKDLGPVAASVVGPDGRQADPAGGSTRKLLGPAMCRRCIDDIRGTMPVSERRVCRVLGQHPQVVPRGGR
jgi:hypothetical protein